MKIKTKTDTFTVSRADTGTNGENLDRPEHLPFRQPETPAPPGMPWPSTSFTLSGAIAGGKAGAVAVRCQQAIVPDTSGLK